MKRIWILFISLFLIPTLVNAETLTYEVCENGCEYSSLSDVETAIRNISDLSDKDIIINVNSDITSDYHLNIGDFDNMANSVTINGNNHDFNGRSIAFISKQVEINNCSNLREIDFVNSAKIDLKNSNIKAILLYYMDSNGQIKSEEINLSEIFDIDEMSLNSLKTLLLLGNFKIENMDLSNNVLMPIGGTINVYNSNLNKVFNFSEARINITTNIYNSKFNSLKYVNIASEEDDAVEEYERFLTSNLLDSSVLISYDIYDLDKALYNEQLGTYTTVYFDKEAKLKPSEKLNLVDYLDYYTEDKEIEYTIEDESIARMENKELTALKEGSTKVTVTTDEGHVIYRINLVVEKETIPEKIDKMTIKVPITGSKVKAWVVVVSVLLLAVIGVCSYMLIKRKK